jgi:hypothetical protein
VLLVLSSADDEHIPLVTSKLDARGANYVWFDSTDFPAYSDLAVLTDETGRASRRLWWDGRECDLAEVTAVWHRRPGVPAQSRKAGDRTARDLAEHASRDFLEGVWETLECLWLPAKPAIDRRAQNKLWQLALARGMGLDIPKTLVTNRPQEFLKFYSDLRGNVISKSLNNFPFLHEGGGYPGIYTRPVYRRDVVRFKSIKQAPVIFQEYVPKRVEVRATIVGREVFAAEIHSQERPSTRHDWRHFHDERVPYRVHSLPESIARLLIALTRRLGLCFGAVDLIVTPSGRYVFLEINPNGQWGFIEELTGLPIADALADLLVHAPYGAQR